MKNSCMGPKMIAFTAFVMLFVLSFAAFIVSLVNEVNGTISVWW
jgi:hypothetical protein